MAEKKKKSFFTKIFEKMDKKLESKSKEKCCCCSGNTKEKSCSKK